MSFKFRSNEHLVRYFRRHRKASIIVGQLVVVVALGMVVLSSIFGSTLFGAFAQSVCSSGDRTYMVVSGDTLGAIAGRNGTTWQRLASYNHIANANIIYINQHICIPGGGSVAKGGGTGSTGGGFTGTTLGAIRGMGNPFPWGQCTAWAALRYFQLHGVYVPWTTNANAWQWTARAYDYHWQVSSRPSSGSIVNLQPWVQGAYGLGHVGVVERVNSNGSVVVSNMNWGPYPWEVANSVITPGYGVTFITF
jgi:LysM repeat protein